MWVVRRGSIVLLKNWPDRDDAVGSGLHGRLHELEFIVLDFGMCRHGRASKSSTDQLGPYGTRNDESLHDVFSSKRLIEPRERHATARVPNRLGRFRESEILRHIFECVVAACMAAGLVKGEGFVVDASVMEANASRYHGKAPGELDWTDAQRQKRAVAEYLAGLEAEEVQEGGDGRDGDSDGKSGAKPDRKQPKVISPSDRSRRGRRRPTSVCSSGMGSTILSTLSTRSLLTSRRRRHAPMMRWRQPRR
jgi:hypothetical protein